MSRIRIEYQDLSSNTAHVIEKAFATIDQIKNEPTVLYALESNMNMLRGNNVRDVLETMNPNNEQISAAYVKWVEQYYDYDYGKVKIHYEGAYFPINRVKNADFVYNQRPFAEIHPIVPKIHFYGFRKILPMIM